MNKINFKQVLAFTIFFLLATALLQYKSVSKLPARTHAWAQSDHYALALGFLDNGFDFFHPTTFSLNHQFPPQKELKDPQGITSVDFPILHYVVALFMTLFGTTAPWVFRITSILWSFIGLLVLFRTITKVKGFWEAFFVVGFILFQPIYAYYQGGFHVSSAAFNTFLIGASQMLLYQQSKKGKYAVWAYAFLCLASLMRFIHIISLLALLCMHAYNFLKTKKIPRTAWLNLLALFVVLAYFVHNRMLAARYGSVFLGSPIVADNLRDFSEQILRIGLNYARGFLPFTHLLVFGSLLYLFLKRKTTTDAAMQEWKIWIIFSLLGTSLFTVLMSWSLSVHDYYSMDTWLPVITTGLIFLIMHLDFQAIQGAKRIIVLLILVLS